MSFAKHETCQDMGCLAPNAFRKWNVTVLFASTVRRTSGGFLDLIIRITSPLGPNRRVELGQPFIAMLIRLVEIVEIPTRQPVAKTVGAIRLQRLSAEIPAGPASTPDVVPRQEDFIRSLASSRGLLGHGKRPIVPHRRDIKHIVPRGIAAAELPVHRILRVVSIATSQNGVDGVIARLLSQLAAPDSFWTTKTEWSGVF